MFNAVADALASDARLQGLPVVRNPKGAEHLGAGKQLIAVKWGSDSRLGEHGRSEQRKFRLIVASISRVAVTPDKDADAIHVAALDVVREQLPTLATLPEVSRIRGIAETDVTPDIEGLQIDGASVLSAWEIDYDTRRD